MSKTSPGDEFRTELADGINAALTEILSDSFVDVYGDDIRSAVVKATEDWRTKREITPSADDHPLAEVKYGHYIQVNLPWVPETEDEKQSREARLAAYLWDADDGPPLPGVRMTQLLRQSTWWRFRKDDRLVPIPIEDMTHEHRLSVLGWLRDHAAGLHTSADLELLNAPDDVIRSHENQPPAEWLEEHELVQALAYWTTPYGESPLTWRPMNEAPRGIPPTPIVVRYRQAGQWQIAIVVDSLEYRWVHFPSYEPLLVPDGHGGEDYARPVEWRELRDEEREKPAPPCDCERGETCPRCRATPWCDCEAGEICEH